MKKPEIDTSGSSMPHWGNQSRSSAFLNYEQRLAANQIDESPKDKATGLSFLEQHNLPRYQKVSFSLMNFLNNPDSQINLLPKPVTGKYYTSIVDEKTGKRIFKLNQSRRQILPFIQAKLKSEEISKESTMTLSEYWPNLYGGNIIIGEDGQVVIELVKGKHAKLAKGLGGQILVARSDPFTGILKFKTMLEDDSLAYLLKTAVTKAFNLIPQVKMPLAKNTSLGRFRELENIEGNQLSAMVPIPGYYEFILTKKPKQKKSADLQTIFLDSRTGQAAKKYFF